MGELQTNKAKANFQKALTVNPESIEVLENLYQLAKQQKNDLHYKNYATKLIHSYVSHAQFEQMLATFASYLNKFREIPQISDSDYLLLIRYLIKIKNYQRAESTIISINYLYTFLSSPNFCILS
ncbi:MAG: hypothetical protein QM479_11510 [Pseudomonadota bacterium]